MLIFIAFISYHFYYYCPAFRNSFNTYFFHLNTRENIEILAQGSPLIIRPTTSNKSFTFNTLVPFLANHVVHISFKLRFKCISLLPYDKPVMKKRERNKRECRILFTPFSSNAMSKIIHIHLHFIVVTKSNFILYIATFNSAQE